MDRLTCRPARLVSKNDEFCIKNERFRIKKEELFEFKMMNFAGLWRNFAPGQTTVRLPANTENDDFVDTFSPHFGSPHFGSPHFGSDFSLILQMATLKTLSRGWVNMLMCY